MYSSIPEFNPDSALCDSTAFTTCFLLFRTQKDIQSKKKAHCKVDLLCQRAFLSGASNRNRTCNLLITNQLHCQLCYTSGNSNIISQSAGVCQGLHNFLYKTTYFSKKIERKRAITPKISPSYNCSPLTNQKYAFIY